MHVYDKDAKRLYTGDGRVFAPLEVQAGASTTRIAAPDGSEVYEFDTATGIHRRTLHGLTGAPLWRFEYNATFSRLVSMADGFNNKTRFRKSQVGSSRVVEVVTPFGLVTRLEMTADGQISRLVNPAGEAYAMSYTDNKLLASFTKPRGEQSTFTYDQAGRLLTDSGPAGSTFSFTSSFAEITDYRSLRPSVVLERTQDLGDGVYGYYYSIQIPLGGDGGPTQEVLSTSGTGLSSTITTTDGAGSGQLTHDTRFPDGSTATLERKEREYEKTQISLGVQTERQLAPDPRWGWMAPYPTTATLTIDGSPINVRNETTRTADLAASDDPFSVTTLTELTNQQGQADRQWRSKYRADTRTWTHTSPLGRRTIATLNPQGLLLTLQRGTLAPVRFTYDARGRLERVAEGAGRTTTFTYNPAGQVSVIQDGLGHQTQLAYDLAGRVTEQTLPDGSIVRLS